MDLFSWLELIFIDYGYVAVFIVLLLCGFGVPIPEDVTLVAGGVIAGLGHANPHFMVVVGLAGVLIGDGVMFLAGRIFGYRILRLKWVARIITRKRYIRIKALFTKYGNWVLFIARFLPGLRTPIYITSGITRRVSIMQFLIMDGLAALISVPVWIYLGVFGAENIDWLEHKIHQFQVGIFALLGIGALILVSVFWRKYRAKKLAKLENKPAE